MDSLSGPPFSILSSYGTINLKQMVHPSGPSGPGDWEIGSAAAALRKSPAKVSRIANRPALEELCEGALHNSAGLKNLHD